MEFVCFPCLRALAEELGRYFFLSMVLFFSFHGNFFFPWNLFVFHAPRGRGGGQRAVRPHVPSASEGT